MVATPQNDCEAGGGKVQVPCCKHSACIKQTEKSRLRLCSNSTLFDIKWGGKEEIDKMAREKERGGNCC